MPPKKQPPGPRRTRAVTATAKAAAVSNPSPNVSDSSVPVESPLNHNEKLSCSQIPAPSTLDSTLTVPEIPPVPITVANAEECDKRQNKTLNDKIGAGNETLALENGTPEFPLGIGSGKEEKDSIVKSAKANGDPLTKNVSEGTPKKKTVKVVKVVKKVVKKRVPKSLLKTVAAELASENIIDDGREKISSEESNSLSIKDSGINNSSGSAEDKQLEKRTEILDHHLTGFMPEPEVETVATSFSAPIDMEKCDGGINVPVQETDSSAKLVGVPAEVENLHTLSKEKEKEASVSEIPVDGKTNEAIGSEIPVNDEKKEASVSEIPLDAGKTECTVEKSDSAIEIPVEVVNEDSIGDRAQVAGTSGYEGKKEDSETSNGRIALSGELEALERKRKRKTEIFIGGLNPEAKEEDLRKVFEVVGDIVELRLMVNTKTGKNKGYAFVRYASAADAKQALEKYSNVEICGKQCATQPVEGNDTIFLGNIDKNWKEEDVIKLLQEIGIEKIDKVTVMANPNNLERNRGFAFVELESCRDAQTAFKKLQKKDLGKLKNVKVSWAEPLIEPDEEELLKVKSVYVEYLPPSWNEEKIRSHFTKYGEIETVALSRNLHSSRRKDFAFINFTTREAALACIESLNHETLHDEGSQVYVKVSLAKPPPKGKPQKKVTMSISKETTKKKVPSTSYVKPVDARNKVTPMITMVNQRNDDMKPTGTSELEKLLAERALRKQMQARLGTSIANEDYTRPRANEDYARPRATEDYTRPRANEDYTLPFPGHKRPFSAFGDDLHYLDPRGYSRMRVENPFPIERLSHGEVPSGVGTTSRSYYQQPDADYNLGHRYSDYANSLQREEAPYRGIGRDYRRY